MGRSSGRSSGGSRSSAGSSSSRGSLFGSKPAAPAASSRGYATSAAAPGVATRQPHQQQSYGQSPAVQHGHQQPHAQQQHGAHAQPQAQAGGGLGSGILGGIVQGMAFGGGSAVAHRAVDGIMGPRTVVHDHQGNAVEVPAGNDNAPVAAANSSWNSSTAEADNGTCKQDFGAFNRCMQDNAGNFNSCQFLYDVLSQCRRSVAENKQWA